MGGKTLSYHILKTYKLLKRKATILKSKINWLRVEENHL